MKTVLFDLDGTLLPMDQEIFTKAYFKALAAAMLPYGYEPRTLVKAVWNGMAAMTSSHPGRTNEEMFWESFERYFGQKAREDKPRFDEFYRTGFHTAKAVCSMNPLAKETVELIRRLGMKTAVATLPVFPADAITARIEWSGVPLSSFEFYTSYETCTACKPDPDYYREILTKQGGKAGDYLMVGNNVDEDMIAESVGMKVFLLTDCLINEHDRDISVYPRGGFRELQEYLKAMA